MSSRKLQQQRQRHSRNDFPHPSTAFVAQNGEEAAAFKDRPVLLGTSRIKKRSLVKVAAVRILKQEGDECNHRMEEGKGGGGDGGRRPSARSLSSMKYSRGSLHDDDDRAQPFDCDDDAAAETSLRPSLVVTVESDSEESTFSRRGTVPPPRRALAATNLQRCKSSYALTTEPSLESLEEEGSSSRTDSLEAVRRDLTLLQARRESIKARSMTNVADIVGGGRPKLLASHARERSFLLGSCGPKSLLGAEELDRCLPNRTLRVFVGTWNMNGQNPPRFLSDFLLPQSIEYVPDLLVISTQESFSERTEWEVRLQDTLGPSHVLYHSASLGTLHTAVFLRRDLIWFCSVPDVDSFNTWPGQFKTKGAVALGFFLFGTSLLFVNCHLTAHQENAKDRVNDLRKISAVMNLPKALPMPAKHKSSFSKKRDFSDNFDAVFWCGDLNFRLEQTREVVLKGVEEESCEQVLGFDQLNYLKSEGLVFRGYSEEKIAFPPTFKYDVGTDRFDTSYKQRVPSYTDRILHKAKKNTAVRPLHYDSVPAVVTSDHKPVWGMWEVVLKPGTDGSVPLSGGMFNRAVYLEGQRRRAEAMQPFGGMRSGKGKCQIQ